MVKKRARERSSRAAHASRTAASAAREQRSTQTEQRILDAAHRVFLRRGSAGARTQEIADEAGVNKALLHYYFRTKERLAAAVFARAASRLLPPVIATLASDDELETKVERVIEIELDVLLRHPYLPGYIISELTHNSARAKQLIAALTGIAIEDLAPRVLEVVARQIRERAQEGQMRPIAPDQFILNLLSLCVFPFAARPMIQAVLQLNDAAFAELIARRKRDLPVFFLQGLRP
ncbi:MAG TPA: helix-turn-helix domain-containing protein [Gemmatimonadaceae bacterium]|jgi:AcrR family transcriptional regulator